MSKQPQISVRYSGAATVSIYSEGRAVVHTSNKQGKTPVKFISVCGGPVVMDTLLALELKALLGPCAVAIGSGKPKTLKTGGTVKIPEGSTFTLKSDAAVLQCTLKPGPGLGNPTNPFRP